MAISDYRRPSEDQIEHHYRCIRCNYEISVPSIYGGPETCHCGGVLQLYGESYPSSAEDWNEERYDVNDDWHRRP